MFIYQTKINGKDGLVALSETQDAGKQTPIFGQEVYTVSEVSGVLVQKDLVLTESGDTQKYTIVFADSEGEPLEVKEVPYGETPVYTGEQIANFKEWDPEVAPVTADAVYTAVVEAPSDQNP